MPHVTFEQAKWLKEKEFDLQCNRFYSQNDNSKNILLDGKTSTGYLAPYQHQVVEWLDKKDFYVSVSKKKGIGFDCSIRILDDSGDYIEKYNRCFNTRQEAYSAAFDYIKENNLI